MVWIAGQFSLRFDLGTCFGDNFDPSDAAMLSLQVSCLCGSAPCLLCGCCPSAKNSTVSRLLFTFFLFLGTLVSIIMIIPGVEKELHKVNNSWRSWACSPQGRGLACGRYMRLNQKVNFWGMMLLLFLFF